MGTTGGESDREARQIGRHAKNVRSREEGREPPLLERDGGGVGEHARGGGALERTYGLQFARVVGPPAS